LNGIIFGMFVIGAIGLFSLFLYAIWCVGYDDGKRHQLEAEYNDMMRALEIIESKE
jgi:cbb3-type cytochrome oxidase subunit 3